MPARGPKLPVTWLFVTEYKGERFERKVIAKAGTSALRRLKLDEGERLIAGPMRGGSY